MDLTSAPVVDVRPMLPDERRELLVFLVALTPDEWLAPSKAPGWTVKDLALHLLEDDLGWLSRGRDEDRSGLLTIEDHDAFLAALNAKNQRWIDGAQQLSRPVVIGLLDWAGREMDAYYASLDLEARGSVSWASDDGVPMFDIAQDLTERWVHQMQMREAVDRVAGYRDLYLALVLRTFVWALPHQFRVPADPGTTLRVDLVPTGSWTLTCAGDGRWVLGEASAAPDAYVRFDEDSGSWRWLTGGAVEPGGMRWEGRADLRDALLDVRGILV